MGITKTALTTPPEMHLHQLTQKSFQSPEHVSFSHEANSKAVASSVKQANHVHQSDRNNLDHDSIHHENSFSNIHKSHHDKDSTTQFYATKGASKSTAKDRSVSESNNLSNDENKKVDGDEEGNDQDSESHRHITTPEALLSSAGQAISSRMGLNNTSSNSHNDTSNLEESASLPAIEGTSLPKIAQPSLLSQNVDTDLGEPLPKLATSSSPADQPESEVSTKSEENPSPGAALSMGSRTDSITADAKGNVLLGASPTLPQDAAHLPGAEANRTANFLHELKTNVTKLIGDNQGKLTFNLKNVGGSLEGMAHATLEVIPHPFHISVQFNTDHAGIFKFLDNQKEGLQTYLTSQFSGQVFDIKSQLTPQPSSQHFGSDRDHSREDIASFDQGNRGNRGSRDEKG